MASLDQCIVDQCKLAWDEEFIVGLANKNNCSGFLKAVAKSLGIPMTETANADTLVQNLIDGDKWSEVESGSEAARLAGTGSFVVAGLKSGDHTPARNNGHVAIVVSGELYNKKYPKCWCGSIGAAQSQGTKSIGEVWNRTDRDNVGYYAYGTAACSG